MKEKKEQEKKERKEKQEDGDADGDENKKDLTELPNRILKRIEKRKRKKLELRQRQKMVKFEKIDYDKLNDDQIAEKYKRVYPEKTEDELK